MHVDIHLETPGNSKNALLHWGDVLALSDPETSFPTQERHPYTGNLNPNSITWHTAIWKCISASANKPAVWPAESGWGIPDAYLANVTAKAGTGLNQSINQ